MAINNQPTIKPRTVTGIFTRYIAKTLPLAFDESMSYYECLCALLEYINQTIVTDINNVNDGLEELQTFYEELQTYVNDYFKNLDVQEEINNKLDDMVEAGTLQEIIADYLNSKAVFGYDTLADMKSSTNLIDGSYARTLGYYAKNDNGGALYKIRTITNEDIVDEAEIIALSDNTLIAELISNQINVNSYGAYGDGVHDDTQAIQKAFNNPRLLSVKFNSSCTYLISDEITLANNIEIYFNNAKIISNNANASIFISGGVNDIQTIHDLYFDGNFISNYGLKVSNNYYTKVLNPKIRNCKTGIYVFRNSNTGRGSIFANDVSIQNDITTVEQYNAVANSIGIDIENTDSQIMNGNIKDFKTSIKCSSSTLIYGVHAWNYYTEFVKNGNIMVDASGGIRMIGCYCDGIPTMVKQNIQTTYSNIDIASCVYHYVISDQSVSQFTPVPIIKGTADKVNISNSTFESNFYNQNYPIANTFEYLFVSNTYCSKTYYENYYKGTLSDDEIGTLTYERVDDVVYYSFTAIGSAVTGKNFATSLPTWAYPNTQLRLTLTDSASGNVTITRNGEVRAVTAAAWASGNGSYPARYGLQKYNS